MLGVIFSIISGAAMSFQGVINTRLGEKIGLFEANTFVQGTALLFSVATMFIFGNGNFKDIIGTEKIYLIGGILGLIITVTVMLSIRHSSPTLAISVILITQLLVAAGIDALGILGIPKVPFTIGKYIGLAVMLAGVLIFKLF